MSPRSQKGKKTRFQKFKEQWKDCTRCPLHETRSRVVLHKGSIPADILFMGEAPGDSENALGKPFEGPAGRQLDRITALAGCDDWRCAYSNIICCLPRHRGEVKHDPTPEEAFACSDRLNQYLDLVKPRLVVLVGKVATTYFQAENAAGVLSDRHSHIPTVEIYHPARILREHVAKQEYMAQECVVTIIDGIEEFLREKD